jgi:Protein of unknown function (DUF2510)
LILNLSPGLIDMSETGAPQGWYSDSENPGGQRYWDGRAWTEHRAPATPPVAPPVSPPAAPAVAHSAGKHRLSPAPRSVPSEPTSAEAETGTAPVAKKTHRGLWIALPAVAAAVVVIAVASGGTGSSPANNAAPSTSPTQTTPAASDTGAPATTSAPATPPAAPIAFTGVGDKVITLSGATQTDPRLVTLSYRGSDIFIVDTLDSSGAQGQNLVYAIGIYAGTVPMDFATGSSASAIKVQTVGRWTLVIKPLTDARAWSGSKIIGNGDDVINVTAVISQRGINTINLTHKGSDNFIVDAYGDTSGDTNLVNAIGTYSGQHVLPRDAVVMVVQAGVGVWTATKE